MATHAPVPIRPCAPQDFDFLWNSQYPDLVVSSAPQDPVRPDLVNPTQNGSTVTDLAVPVTHSHDDQGPRSVYQYGDIPEMLFMPVSTIAWPVGQVGQIDRVRRQAVDMKHHPIDGSFGPDRQQSRCMDGLVSQDGIDMIAPCFPSGPLAAFSMHGSELGVPDLTPSSSVQSTPIHSRKNSYQDGDDSVAGLFTGSNLAGSRPVGYDGRRMSVPTSVLIGRKNSWDRTLGQTQQPSMKHRRLSKIGRPVSVGDRKEAMTTMTINEGEIESSPPSSGISTSGKERTPHTEVERKYRHGINIGITMLGSCVPDLRRQMEAHQAEIDQSVDRTRVENDDRTDQKSVKNKQPSKLAIIQGAADYIHHLEHKHELLEREYAALRNLFDQSCGQSMDGIPNRLVQFPPVGPTTW